jgi:hypothetical protein
MKEWRLQKNDSFVREKKFKNAFDSRNSTSKKRELGGIRMLSPSILVFQRVKIRSKRL